MYYDPAGLERFVKAQQYDYDTALREIRSGRKRSHWMWYIFPQLQGLGFSSTAVSALLPSATPTCDTRPVARSPVSASSPNAYTKLPSALTVTVLAPLCHSGRVDESLSYTRKCIVFV